MVSSLESTKKVVITHSPQFQKEIVSIILNNPLFASRYYSHIYKNADLKSYKKVISVGYLEKLVDAFYTLYEKNSYVSPTLGLVQNFIQNSLMDQDDIDEICEQLKKIAAIKIDNTKLHEEELIRLAIVIKNINFYMQVSPSFKTGAAMEIYKFNDALKTHLEDCAKIQFSQNNLVDTKNFFQVINEYARDCYTNIPTGIPELDEELNGGGEFGGLGRQEVTILLSGVNDGKSLSTIAIECNALRKGYKTRHINYEGKKLQPPMRFIANLSGVHYKRLAMFRDTVQKDSSAQLEGYLTRDEFSSVLKSQDMFSNNFKIFHEIRNCDIGALETQVTEAYAEEPFDLLVIDYAQHITANHVVGAKHERLAYVFRRLEILAATLNIAIITPMQVNRAGLNELRTDSKDGVAYPVYSMDNVAEVKSAVDTAATIITYNRTPEERRFKKGRFAILKQREGRIGKQVGICSDWDTMNTTKGDRYYVGYGDDEPAERSKPFAAIEKAIADGSKALVLDMSKLPCEAPESIMRQLISTMDSLDKKLKELTKVRRQKELVESGRISHPDNDMSLEEYIITVEDQIDDLSTSIDSDVEGLEKNDIIKNFFAASIAVKKEEIQKFVIAANINALEKSGAEKDVIMAVRALKRLFTEDSGKLLLDRMS